METLLLTGSDQLKENVTLGASLAVCSAVCYCCEINWSAKKWRSFFFLLVCIRMFILMTIEWTLYVGLKVSESSVEM